MTAMSMGTQLPPGGWAVTGQTPTTRLIQGNPRPVDGYTVTFVTSANVTGSVFIPGQQYTAANVQAAIAAQVAQLDAVSALTHESVS